MATDSLTAIDRLWFEPVLGPEFEGFWLEPGNRLLVGRASKCDVRLPDGTISRQHAVLESGDSGCLLTDLGSRLGTQANDVQVEPNSPIPLAPGDMIRIGPWMFRLALKAGAPVSMRTIDDTGTADERVQRLAQSELGALAQHRLNLLMDFAGSINAAADEKELAASLVQWAIDGTGFQRAAMLRQVGGDDEVEVAAYLDGDSRDSTKATFSRSLLRGASGGDVACLLSGETGSFGQSIADLNIHSALCAPIMIDNVLIAYLYLDARQQERAVQSDAAGFCQALCRMAGLSVANLRRLDMQLRQQRMEQDLSAAREAQQFMLPEATGTQEACKWAFLFKPGRQASGDLLDLVPLPGSRLCLCVGDVSGKGAGAAILMAASQSFLHARLEESGDPAVAVAALNEFVCDRSALNRFLTLWVGVFDAEAEELRYVDAGHGHWMVRREGGACDAAPTPDSCIVGVDSTSAYASAVLSFHKGDRVAIFSDGVVEQQGNGGDQFGMERVAAVLGASDSSENDVKSLLVAVMQHAGRKELDDDTTIASVGII
jgi:serine phosphatase RsbU (regulator of sigma subunit)